MISAILKGELKNVPTETDPIFGLHIPTSVAIEGYQEVPQEILNPRNTWKSTEEYDQARNKLANMFIENFKKYSQKNPQLQEAGPKIRTEIQ